MDSGVHWIQGSPAKFESYGAEVRKIIMAEVLAIMDAVVAEAAQKMREFIAERGLPHSKGHGRVDTGHMRDMVSSSITSNGETITGAFGWLEGGEVYFLAQENGAVLWNGGVIMPMLAMHDAGLWAIEEIVKRLREVIQ